MAEEIHHNAAGRRFEWNQAVAEYRIDGDRMIFTHTWVPSELRGQGIAERLVEAGMQYARQQKKRVVPQCSYVEVFLRRHPEYQNLR